MDSLISFIKQVKDLENAEFCTAATIHVFIGIDLCCFLGLPADRKTQKRQDFINWVDQYMVADPRQPYQYCGKDVYAARCAMLHNYGSEAEIHSKDSDIKKFIYSDGGRHLYRPELDSSLVIIGMRSFIDDFVNAVDLYLADIVSDEKIRENMESRIPNIFRTIPYPS